ncbi:MAG: 1-deoxy-D-xylulose-5-phosphate reductoisomerase [Clostridia bacterium]|nr:1-deoxy-D-xylulose-5-phosphate reductoisomerase [Clostridia bacterium]
MREQISVLGSTGSIGKQTLEVARQENINICALAAHRSIDILETQIREFKPQIAAVADQEAAKILKTRVADTNTKVLSGFNGVCEAATLAKSDLVINALVGIAGLKPTMAAIEAGKDIALANKETLVTGGKLVTEAVKKRNLQLLPVDSEHSAIFQCLQGVPSGSLRKILLTCSGGPFYGKTRAELENITPSDALRHPNWDMGAKITIDSATLMNKGLEIIEAVHLFSVQPQDIEVLVHRQSIIHSAIELSDGAVLAQMGTPDMRLPIQYAITYPTRSNACCKPLDLAEIGMLTFSKPDVQTFDCLQVCIDAISQGGLKPTAANGANEQAVALFLSGKIRFLQIAELVRAAMEAQPPVKSFSMDDICAADAAARQFVLNRI